MDRVCIFSLEIRNKLVILVVVQNLTKCCTPIPYTKNFILHHNFSFFLHQKFCIFYRNFFWYQKFCIFYPKTLAFFTPKIFHFLHEFFLRPKIWHFLHQSFLHFLHQNFYFFYTNFFSFFTQYLEIFKLSRRKKLKFFGLFPILWIWGLPDDTLENFRQSTSIWKKIGPMGIIGEFLMGQIEILEVNLMVQIIVTDICQMQIFFNCRIFFNCWPFPVIGYLIEGFIRLTKIHPMSRPTWFEKPKKYFFGPK